MYKSVANGNAQFSQIGSACYFDNYTFGNFYDYTSTKTLQSTTSAIMNVNTDEQLDIAQIYSSTSWTLRGSIVATFLPDFWEKKSKNEQLQ